MRLLLKERFRVGGKGGKVRRNDVSARELCTVFFSSVQPGRGHCTAATFQHAQVSA